MAQIEPVLGARAIDSSKAILLVISTFVMLLGMVLFCGGVYLAVTDHGAQVVAKVLGSSVNTTSVGFGIAFLGVVFSSAVFIKLLGTLGRIAEAKD